MGNWFCFHRVGGGGRGQRRVRGRFVLGLGGGGILGGFPFHKHMEGAGDLAIVTGFLTGEECGGFAGVGQGTEGEMGPGGVVDALGFGWEGGILEAHLVVEGGGFHFQARRERHWAAAMEWTRDWAKGSCGWRVVSRSWRMLRRAAWSSTSRQTKSARVPC